MGQVSIPAGRLSQASRLQHAGRAAADRRATSTSLLGLILVILDININILTPLPVIMDVLDDIFEIQERLAPVIDRVHYLQVPDEVDDIIDNCHRHLVLANRLLESLDYAIQELQE